MAFATWNNSTLNLDFYNGVNYGAAGSAKAISVPSAMGRLTLGTMDFNVWRLGQEPPSREISTDPTPRPVCNYLMVCVYNTQQTVGVIPSRAIAHANYFVTERRRLEDFSTVHAPNTPPAAQTSKTSPARTHKEAPPCHHSILHLAHIHLPRPTKATLYSGINCRAHC